MKDVSVRLSFKEDASKKLEEISVSGEKAKKVLDGVGDTLDNSFDSSGLDALAASVGEAADGIAGEFESLGKKILAAVSIAAVGDQIRDFASSSIELGQGYSSMMSEVQAISGATGKDLEMLENTAREYGAATVFSAADAAEALKYMSLAGWDANQSASALGGVLNLAAASGMELGAASDMVTDYLSAFGMEASQSTYFADMLAYAQSNSNTTAAQLGEAYKNAAANLHAAGQDVETTTSLLEAMANQGNKGSEAGTALAATMRDITQKMEDGAIKIGDTSVAVQDSNGNFRDLTDILTDVESATDGMGDAQKAAALGATFTSDSIKALNMILAEGMDKVSGYEEELRQAGGTAEMMAEIMNDNLTGDIANMDSAYEEMQLQVFEAIEEPLRDGVQWITDDIIPTLTGWVPDAFGAVAEGIRSIGSELSPLINTVLKNPQAIAKAFTSIGAGFVAMKTVNTGMKIAKGVSDAGGLISALGKLGTSIFGSPWAAGAAAVVGAITAVGLAIEKYNDIQVRDSLEAHFGSITLDEDQIEEMAGRIINATWLTNINLALGHFENADEFAEKAEEALAENDALEWKARVGITLSDDEQSSYISNIEAFTSNIEQELTERTLAAKMIVKEFNIEMADGSSLGTKIEEWASEDLGEMQYLSAGLTNLVEKALEDGIIDVDEQAAIDQLQTKISNIMQGWKKAEAQAEMDLLTQKYGRLSGADLESGSFTSLVTELGEQRETAAEALYEEEKEFYTMLNGLNLADAEGIQRISDSDLKFLKEQLAQVDRNEKAAMLMESVLFEKNTMEDAYGDLLTGNYSNIETGAQQSVDSLNSLYTQYENGVVTMEALFNNMENSVLNSSAGDGRGLFGWVTNADQAALADIYEVMKPDMDAMREMIGKYIEDEQAVPQMLMDQFNEAMMLGAAAGDYDAAWQVYANQIVESGNEELISAIQSGEIAAPQELRDALELALTETTDEPLTLEDLYTEVENIKVNEGHVDELLATAFEGLTYQGTTTLDGGEVALEYTVNEGETLSGIMQQYGIVWSEVEQQIREANPEIEDLNVIMPGQVIKIPEVILEAADVDTSQVQEQAEEQAAEAGSDTEITLEKDVKVTAGSTDASEVGKAAQETADEEFSSALQTDGTADVTLEKGTDNVAEVYSEVGEQVKTAWETPYSASGRVNVTLTADYTLANPTKTITFGGGATGSATVTAALHASGGIFNDPHFGMIAEAGYPEAIIPIDGSQNAYGLWQKTGEMLGVVDRPVSVAPGAVPTANGEYTDRKSEKRVIDLNINGKGSMKINTNMSKEDVVAILLENMKESLFKIVEQEIFEEGDLAYEY